MKTLRGSVIVPTWNSRGVVTACLDSVATQQLTGGFETIVVDNASTDGTLDILRRRDDIRIVANDRNAGFSAANNQGAEQAGGRILFFLNADTELLAPNTLDRLASAVEAPRVAIAGPMLLNPDGSLQPSCAGHPSIARALVIGSGLHHLLPEAARARVAPEHWTHDQSIDVDWVKGAALAVRADVFRKLGGFWQTTYAEEADLAYRAHVLGFRVRFVSSARVKHVGRHSVAQRWSEAERAARIAEAELAFLAAHYIRPHAAAIQAITATTHALRGLIHGLRGDPKAAVYRAMANVYAGRRTR